MLSGTLSSDVLRNIWYILLDIKLWLANLGPIENAHIKRIMKLQNKAIRIINFTNFREPPLNLYQKSKIVKLKDNITLDNFLYVHKSK